MNEIKLNYIFLPDINECTSNPCQQNCKNTAGSYQCSCNTGFEVDPKDSKKCLGKKYFAIKSFYFYQKSITTKLFLKSLKIILDIDECTTSNPCQQNCKNTAGSYQCSCNPGFEVDPKDSKKCLGK